MRLHGRWRRGLGRRTPPIRRKRRRRTRCGSGRSRRRRMRRAIGRFGDCRTSPPSAARCRHDCARRGRGAGVAPRGYPSTQSVPEHKTAGSPRGSTAVSFWVNANGKSTPGGLRAVATSHPARASTKRAKLQKVAETAIAGEGGGEKLGDSAIWQGSVLVTELDVMTGTEERLHARSKLPEGRLT